MENLNYLVNMGMGGENETRLQKKMSDLRKMLNEQDGLAGQEKLDIMTRLDEIDFLLNKYDDFFEEFSKIATAMAGADFKQRFAENTKTDEFLATLIGIFNTVMEELEHRAMKKKMVEYTFDLLSLKNTIIIMTDTSGIIEFIHGSAPIYGRFNEQVLVGDKISGLFKDYKQIERRIKMGMSLRDIEILFHWNTGFHPCWVDTTLCANEGKIEGMVYIIYFPQMSDN